MLATCVLALAGLLAPGDERDLESDTVYLTDGKSVTGRVVYEDPDQVIVRNGSREKSIPRAEVKDVDSRQRSLATLLDRLAAFGPGGPPDIASLLELARFAEHARLGGEARLLRLWVLLVEPDDPEANAALGNRERKGHWSIKHRGRWFRTADLGELVEEWGDRWELESSHFDLATNLPLKEAIAAAFDLERFYRAFFDLFARELLLTEPDEVLEVQAHADKASYPEPSDGRRASFSESDRIVHVLTEGGAWRDDLFHELSQQLVYFTTQRTKEAKGRAPAWLDEGLAEALATGSAGPAGLATFDLSARSRKHFATHASADEPYDLDRVLAFQHQDYVGTQHRALKYAQSYTLLHFLLYGAEGSRRQELMDFMRSAWAGRSSTTDFKRLLDVEGSAFADLEEAWNAYAAQHGR